MFRFRQSMQIDRPAAEVWPYLIAFEQVPLWEHGILEVRQITPGRPQVGTEVTARRVYAGRESHLTGQIVGFEDGRSATMALHGGPLAESLVEYAVEPIDDRHSRVTYSAWGDLIPWLRFLHSFVPAMGRHEARKNLAALKARIEGGGVPPRSAGTAPSAD